MKTILKLVTMEGLGAQIEFFWNCTFDHLLIYAEYIDKAFWGLNDWVGEEENSLTNYPFPLLTNAYLHAQYIHMIYNYVGIHVWI